MPSDESSYIDFAIRTDVGMRRATNQDAVVVVPLAPQGRTSDEGGQFLMVADGMGAHAAGELASKMAVDSVPHAFCKSKQASTPAALRHAVRDANAQIHAKGESSAEFHGMGTTCSCLVLSREGALAAHVGDSRIYRLRDSVLEQLTFDHSLVWEMAAASAVTEEEVPSCIPKNVITRSLGPHEKVNIDLEGPHELAEGDVYLLCSDGLSGVVNDHLLGAVMGAMPVDKAAQTLIDLANLYGGPDNISVIIAQVGRGVSIKRPSADQVADKKGQGWIAAGVAIACLAAFGWFMSHEYWLGMLLSAAGCGAAMVMSLLWKTLPESGLYERAPEGPYGNGPYRSFDCRSPQEAAGSLSSLVAELAEIESASPLVSSDEGSSVEIFASKRGLSLGVDWSRYVERQHKADKCYQEGRHADAVLQYADLVRDVMDEYRQARPAKNS